MNIALLIGLSITLLYVFLMLALRFGMSKLKPFVLESLTEGTQFSIVIPFRNEAENLEALLQSIENLNYPPEQFEILLINDDSTDDHLPIIEKYKKRLPNLKCLENKRQSLSPKKDAITTGIGKANYNWILTTDADCTVPKNWLKAFNVQIQKSNSVLVVGLVKFNFGNSFLERFQVLDILSLQATLLGAFGLQRPILCNGANLCYTKNLFAELNGFSNNNTIASGDDMFLLEETLKKYPDKVSVLNSFEATVTTNPEPTFKDLMAQRQRWAAKATNYTNGTIKGVGLLVFVMNLLVLSSAVMSVLGLLNANFFLILFLVKFNVDALLLLASVKFFKQEKVMQSYILSSLLYPLFSVVNIFLAFTTTYNWKDRQFKK